MRISTGATFASIEFKKRKHIFFEESDQLVLVLWIFLWRHIEKLSEQREICSISAAYQCWQFPSLQCGAAQLGSSCKKGGNQEAASSCSRAAPKSSAPSDIKNLGPAPMAIVGRMWTALSSLQDGKWGCQFWSTLTLSSFWSKKKLKPHQSMQSCRQISTWQARHGVGCPPGLPESLPRLTSNSVIFSAETRSASAFWKERPFFKGGLGWFGGKSLVTILWKNWVSLLRQRVDAGTGLAPAPVTPSDPRCCMLQGSTRSTHGCCTAKSWWKRHV